MSFTLNYSITPQELYPFLDEQFEVPQGSFRKDFPIWVHPTPHIQTWGYYHEHQLIACLGMRLGSLNILHQKNPLPCTIWGAIATHKAYRKQQLASKLIQQGLEYCKNQGIQTVFLFTAHTSLYERHGFHVTPWQKTLSLDKIALKPHPHLKIALGWHSSCFSLLAAKPIGLQLHITDKLWIQEQHNLLWIRVYDGSKLIGCVGMNRGIDLADTIHEWAGAPEAMEHAFYTLQQQHPHATILCSYTLLELLGLAFDPKDLQPTFSCMIQHLTPTSSPTYPLEKTWIWGLDAV